jgi:hypothetical protein
MGIQPIDLQTMYTQLSNVSKTMAGAQQAQLTEAMQQQGNIQRNMENAAKVQQTSNEKSDTNSVNQNGSGAGSYYGSGKKGQGKKNAEENHEEIRPPKSDLSYLGTIIDITR